MTTKPKNYSHHNLFDHNWAQVADKSPIKIHFVPLRNEEDVVLCKQFPVPIRRGYVVHPFLHWLLHVNKRPAEERAKITTLRNYSYKLKRYFDYLIANDIDYRQALKKDLQRYIQSLVDEGNTGKTVNAYSTLVVQFYEFITQKGYPHSMKLEKRVVRVQAREGDLLAYIPRERAILPGDLRVPENHDFSFKTLTEEQVVCLFKIFMELDPVYGAMLMMQYATGLRVSALVEFRGKEEKQNTDFISPAALKTVAQATGVKKRSLKITYRAKFGQQKNCSMPAFAWEFIWNNYIGPLYPERKELYERDHRKNCEARLEEGEKVNTFWLTKVGKPVTDTDIFRAFKVAQKKMGTRVTSHMIRHTFATHKVKAVLDEAEGQEQKGDRLLEAEFNKRVHYWLRDQLGHASVETTMKYIHTARQNGVRGGIFKSLQRSGLIAHD